jgi:hypothetical protein
MKIIINIINNKELYISLFIFSFISLLNNIYDSSKWDILGNNYNKALSSSEKINHNYLLKRWRNSHTSIVFIIIGIKILLKSLNNISKFVGYNIILLGLASYGWWGSQKLLLWKIDNSLMELHLISLLLLLLTKYYKYIYEKIIIISFILCWLVRTYYIEKVRLCFISFLSLISFIYTIKYTNLCNYRKFCKGLFLIFLGLYCKYCDYYYNFMWGTSLLHIFYPIGFYQLFLSIY